MLWACAIGIALLYLAGHVYFELYVKRERVKADRGIVIYIGVMCMVMGLSASMLLFGNV